MPHSRASNSQPLSCPELKLVPADQPEEIRAAFVNSPMLSFCQPWRSAKEDAFQEGSVSIGWHDDTFFYFAELQDSHPHSRSTERNQRLWLLSPYLMMPSLSSCTRLSCYQVRALATKASQSRSLALSDSSFSSSWARFSLVRFLPF